MAHSLRKYSYDIFIQLGTLHLGVKFPCKVGTLWETHMKNIQASTKPDLVNGVAFLSQTLSNHFVLDFDMNSNLFTPRQSTLKILLYTEKGVREAGQVDFDLTGVLNKRLSEMTLELPLQKCPDKNAKVSFTIKTILKEEVKNPHSQTTFTAGLMPDIVLGVKPQSQVPSPAPTNDGFKKKVKIQNEPLIPPSIKIQPPTAPSVAQTQHSDNFQSQREGLLAENSSLSTTLMKVQTENESLRKQLRKALQQKQDLYAQMESYNNEVNHLRSQNEELRRMEQMYREAQEQLINARTQLAKIFNAATELGGPALTDRLQSAVGISQRQL